MTDAPDDLGATPTAVSGDSPGRGAVILAALGTVVVGLTLKVIDARGLHVPGHSLYNAMVFLPGVAQLVYVVPAWVVARRSARPGRAAQIASGAGVVAVANGLVVGCLVLIDTLVPALALD